MILLTLNLAVLIPLWLAAEPLLSADPTLAQGVHYAAAGLLALNGAALFVRGFGWPRSFDELLFGPEPEPCWDREALADWTASAMLTAYEMADDYALDDEYTCRCVALGFIDSAIADGDLPNSMAATQSSPTPKRENNLYEH